MRKYAYNDENGGKQKARSGYYSPGRVSRRLGTVRLFADCEDWFLPELLDFFFVAVCAIIQLTCLYQNISESIIVRTPTTQQ